MVALANMRCAILLNARIGLIAAQEALVTLQNQGTPFRDGMEKPERAATL